MRLVMTLMVRDEADVVGTMLDAHLALGVDHVVATDNGSTDGTRELLQGYAERGVLTLLEGDATRFDQAQVVTRMARHAAGELAADWVINADADEFWWPLAGTLPDVLAAIPPEYGIVVVQRNDFRPAPDGPEPFWERMTYRETASRGAMGARLVPKVAHRAVPGVQVSLGNHGVDGVELQWAPPLQGIEILHYPYRSFGQVERKVQALVERRAGAGSKFDAMADARELYRRLELGELRQWFDGLILSREEAAEQIMAGALLEDRRLIEFAAEGWERRPARPAVTATARDDLDALLTWHRRRLADTHEELVAVREDLATVRADRDDCVARIAELEALRDDLDANLAAERDAHFQTAEALRETGDALRDLRSSRVLRSANAAKRLLQRPR